MVTRLKRVTFKNPLFIACWPGMGEVAIRTGLFLKDMLPFQPFAEIRDSGFFMPQGIVSQNGIIHFPEVDEGTFYYYKDPGKKRDIVLFLAEAQPPMERAYEFAAGLMEFVISLKAQLVMTFASLPQPIDYSKDPTVWGVFTGETIAEEMKGYGVSPMLEGHISGLNGILTGVAREMEVNGACLLAEIPFYTIQIENPKATSAILQVLQKYLGMQFDLGPLREKAEQLGEEIVRLISYIRGEGEGEGDEEEDEEEMPLSDVDIQKIKSELSRFPTLPQSVSRRIEELFVKARQEISYAQELKQLLDHWNVFKEYEDRFLDLFKGRRLDH